MTALRELFAEYGVEFDKAGHVRRGSREVNRLGDKLDDLTSNTTRSERALRRLSTAVGIPVASFRAMGRSIGTASIALAGIATGAAAGAAAGLGRIVSSTSESTREIERWTGRIGISRDALRSWIELGAEYGASVDDVTDALKELQLKAQDALNGGTGNIEIFQRMGISLEDLRPVVNDVEALMALFTTRLNQVSSSAARNTITDELMSDAGTRMNQVFALGTDEIQRRRAEISRVLGPTAELSRAVLQHGQTMRRVSRAWAAFRIQLVSRVLPIVDRVLQTLAAHQQPIMRIIWAVGRIAAQVGGRLVPSFASLDRALSDLEGPILQALRAISRTIEETKILEGVFFAVAVAGVVAAAATITSWGPVALAMIAVVVAVGALAVAYDQVARTIDGGTTALSRFLDSSELLGEGGTHAVVIALKDAWDWVARSISGANVEVNAMVSSLRPVLRILDSIWRVLEFLQGGWIPQAFGGTLIQQAGAAARQYEAARGQTPDEAAAERGRSTSNRAIAAREREDNWRDQRTGAPLDAFGLPMSIPTDVPRVPRRDGAQAQAVNIDAPASYTFNISEATDANGVARIVRQETEAAQRRLVSSMTSMVSDRTEVGS